LIVCPFKIENYNNCRLGYTVLLQADPLISNLYFQVPIQNKSDEQPKLQVSKRYETVILY
jgi:hypothetical protein